MGRAAKEKIVLLEAEVERLKELTNHTYCAFCGERFHADGADATDAITKHIKACPKHPMREPEEQLANMQGYIKKLADVILAYDCGLPTCTKEYPNGMSAIEAAIYYMNALRKALGLKDGDKVDVVQNAEGE